jgi:hypothetical protein
MWTIEIAHHAARIEAMRDEVVDGRNLKPGYLRACGLQFGNVRALCADDPLFARAFELARGRTMVGTANLMNLFMILKFNFPALAPGHIAEFGAYKGGSAIFLATVAQELYPGTKVYAFDSFAGMPDTDARRDVHKRGDFDDAPDRELRDACVRLGLNNLEIVKGPFERTIPSTLPAIGKLRLTHIDCDIYQSVATAYDGCKPHMVRGGYMVFDDPLISSCIGALEAVEALAVRRDGLHAEQAYPHLVYRAPFGV